MDVPYTSHSVLTALQNLSQQTNRVEREAVLKAGLKEILKWFTLAAKNIIENKIKLPKQTTTFMTKHREEIQRLADPSIDEEIKRKIILKPGGGGFLGGVIIRSLLRWDGSKKARKFGDRQPRAPRKRAPQKKKTPKKRTSKKKPVRTIEENDSEDDFLPMKTSSKKRPSKKRKKQTPKKRTSKKKTPKKTKKRTPKKRTPKKRTPSSSSQAIGTPSSSSQHSLSLPTPISPLVSPPLSSPPSSYMNMSMGMSPRSSPRVDVVDWAAQNRRFELAESHPRVDERNITMRKKRTTVSDQPRFPLSRKALLIKILYDLKKTNHRFLDKKRLQFQPIPSKTWSSWSASLREKYRQAKRDKAQLMHNLGRENIFFSSSPIQTERIKKRLLAKSYKH